MAEKQDFYRLTLQLGVISGGQDFNNLQDAKKVAQKYLKSGGTSYEIAWIRIVESHKEERIGDEKRL